MSETYEEANCDSLESVVEGCRLLVQLQKDQNEWQMAQVLNVRELKKKRFFKVHFLDLNNRLEPWLGEDRLDYSKVYFPRNVQRPRRSSAVAGRAASTIPLANAPPALGKETYRKRPNAMKEKGGLADLVAAGRTSRRTTAALVRQREEEPENSRLFTYKFNCDSCIKGWNKKSELTRHMERSHGPKIFACRVCHTEFATTSLRDEHAKLHDKKYKCHQCPFWTGHRGDFNHHMRGKTCHGKEKYPQPKSDKVVAEETHDANFVGSDVDVTIGHECDEQLSDFIEIQENKYCVEPEVDEELKDECVCTGTGVKCDDDGCWNRATEIECDPKVCIGICRNQRLQNKEGAHGKVAVFLTATKGRGVKATQQLKKNELIMEYLGEVLPYNVYVERKKTAYAQDEHDYCCYLDGGLVIDSHRMGNKCRYVNHSCEPNCEMQLWHVDGKPRMALFTLRAIAAGEELNYKYRFKLFNPLSGKQCFCGSPNCTGTIGK